MYARTVVSLSLLLSAIVIGLLVAASRPAPAQPSMYGSLGDTPTVPVQFGDGLRRYDSRYPYRVQTWDYYPLTDQYVFRLYGKPYPYGHRCWAYAGDVYGTPAFSATACRAYGPRERVPLRVGPVTPLFFYGPGPLW